MTAEVDRWKEALVEEHARASRLLSLLETQQASIIARQFDTLAENIAEQTAAVAELFMAERSRKDAQARLASLLGVPSPGRRADIYPRFPVEMAQEVEALVVRLQNAMATSQRKLQQNVLLLSRSIELAQQVLQRSGVTSPGRTYGAKGRERAFALPGNTLSRWSSVV